MKSIDENVFAIRLKELLALGKKKKGVLEYKEIMDFLSDIELDSEQIDKIYEYLESQGIDVMGVVELEGDSDKDLDLSWVLLRLLRNLITEKAINSALTPLGG